MRLYQKVLYAHEYMRVASEMRLFDFYKNDISFNYILLLFADNWVLLDSVLYRLKQ